MKEIVLFLIPGILEATGIIALSLSLAGAVLRWSRIIAPAIGMAVIMYLVRSIQEAPGLHMIIGILMPFLFLVLTTRVNPSRAFVAAFFSILVLGIIEFGLHSMFLALSGMDPDRLYFHQGLWSILGTLQASILIGLAVLWGRLRPPEEGKWRNEPF